MCEWIFSIFLKNLLDGSSSVHATTHFCAALDLHRLQSNVAKIVVYRLDNNHHCIVIIHNYSRLIGELVEMFFASGILTLHPDPIY